MDVKIKNYLQLSTSLASSGQPNREAFASIARQGYQLVINLSMPDSKTAMKDEGAVVTSTGMSYIHIPVPFEAPDSQQLKTFFTAMDAFSDQKIWIHCALNYRVSAFLYLYIRIIKKGTKEEAERYLLPSWQPNETWLAFIKQSEEAFSDN